jgi:ABC-type nitrate/sulfonate/bicarbonate transport system substrate-binding protein
MRLPSNSIGAAIGALLALPGLASAQTQITVGLPTSPPNVVHMPVIIAQELGLYKKHGIDVKTVSLPGGVHVFRAVLSGNADVGLSPASVTLVARSKGSPAKMLSANLQKFEASMVVRDNVKDMADLKGKRIGIQEPGGFADTISRGVLRAAKVDPKDVSFVSIATEDVPALVANQVDTAILHVEQELLAKEKVPSIHAIARMWEIQPQNLYTVAVATEKSIKEKPQAMQAFVTATIEATRVLYADKKKVMPILVKHTGYPEKIVSDTYDFMVKECIWDANSGLSPERVKFTADLMTRVGNIEQGKTPSYEDVTELSFAKKAIADLGEWKGPVCPSAAF